MTLISTPELLSACSESVLMAPHNPHGHALIWARILLWHPPVIGSDYPAQSWWSRWAWWSSMWYPHKGDPSRPSSWLPMPSIMDSASVIRMDATHWMHKPLPPVGAPTGDGNDMPSNPSRKKLTESEACAAVMRAQEAAGLDWQTGRPK